MPKAEERSRGPTMIENTSKRDPFVHAAGIAGEGQSDYISGMEAAGQRQVVDSDLLPAEILHGSQDEYEAVGFVFGDPVEGDPLFRQATLPEGWRREGSDHAMWSYIVDETGRRCVAIFYKAAFYDRRAHMSMSQV
jgi:hypothetical protein